MTRKPRSLEETPFDIFEAIKRALIRRGFIRQTPQAEKNPLTRKTTKKLTKVTIHSHDILFKTNTVFPFSLFPDTITLDREKMTVATRYFFRVARITSAPIRDILFVQADVGLFFGSLHIASRFFITNPYQVNFLWRKDALKLQHLLQGYIIAQEQDIDCDNIDKDKLIVMLEDLGHGATD